MNNSVCVSFSWGFKVVCVCMCVCVSGKHCVIMVSVIVHCVCVCVCLTVWHTRAFDLNLVTSLISPRYIEHLCLVLVLQSSGLIYQG